VLRGGAGVSGQLNKAILQKTHFESMRELGDAGISGGMDNAESESLARTVTEAAKQGLNSDVALGGGIDEGDPDEAVRPEWHNDLQPANLSGDAKAGDDLSMPQMRVKASFYGCDLYDTDAVDRMQLLTACQSRKSAPAAWRPPQQAGTLTVEVDSCHDLLPGDTCDCGLRWLPDLCNIAGVYRGHWLALISPSGARACGRSGLSDPFVQLSLGMVEKGKKYKKILEDSTHNCKRTVRFDVASVLPRLDFLRRRTQIMCSLAAAVVQNVKKKTLNPYFGEKFLFAELEGRTTAAEFILNVSVYDKDIGSADSFIGATSIDLVALFRNKWLDKRVRVRTCTAGRADGLGRGKMTRRACVRP
jgi:hypothetical protein